MNDLRLVTYVTADPCIFETRWMTGLLRRGRVRPCLPYLTDGHTAAELAAAEHLLIHRNVCGHNKAGAGLRLFFSRPTIRPLLEGKAPKGFLAPYANFLRTRFRGAQVEHDSGPHSWADAMCVSDHDDIAVDRPPGTVLEIKGLGPVELTVHAIEQYIRRFERPPARAWRELTRIAAEVQPARIVGRNFMSDLKHRCQGHYLLEPKRRVLLVIADPDRVGARRRIVTIIKAGDNVRLLSPAV